MKKALLSLAVAGLALSATQGAFAQINNGSQTPITVHRPVCPSNAMDPRSGQQVFWPLFQAYFATSGPLFDNTGATRNPAICLNIHATVSGPNAPGAGLLPGNFRWCGNLQEEPLTKAHPGIFALKARARNVPNDNRQVIDVNCFVAPRGNELGNTVVVQNIRLIKTVGFSRKCPDVFPEVASGRGPLYIQFGNNIRTWWTLLYSPPGTRFEVEATYQVFNTTLGRTIFRTDRWRWEVAVTFESIRALIEVLHSNTIGTCELPCIVAEEMYLALLSHLDRLRAAAALITPTNPTRQRDAQNRLFEMEALIVAFCVFADCIDCVTLYDVRFPPPNEVTQTLLGPAGILDSMENPCCCKLLVDIEKLGEQLGILEPGFPI